MNYHNNAPVMYNGNYVQQGQYNQQAMTPQMQQQLIMQQQQQQMYQQAQQQQQAQSPYHSQQLQMLQQRYHQDLNRGALPVVNGRPIDFNSYINYIQQQGQQGQYPQQGLYGSPNPYQSQQPVQSAHNPYQSSNMASVYNQAPIYGQQSGYGQGPQYGQQPAPGLDSTTGVQAAPSRYSSISGGQRNRQQPQQTQQPQQHQPGWGNNTQKQNQHNQPQQVNANTHDEFGRYASIPLGSANYNPQTKLPEPTHEVKTAPEPKVEKMTLKRKGKVKMKYLGKLPYGNDNVGVTGNVPTPRDEFQELGVIATDRYSSIPDAGYDDENNKGFTSIARPESTKVVMASKFFESGVFSNASSFHVNLKNLTKLSEDFDSLVFARELDKVVTANINDVIKVNYDVTIDSFVDDYVDLIDHIVGEGIAVKADVVSHLESILENSFCRAYREELEEDKEARQSVTESDEGVLEEAMEGREVYGVMEQSVCIYANHFSDLLGMDMNVVPTKVGELMDNTSEPSYFNTLVTNAESAMNRNLGMSRQLQSFLIITRDAVVLKCVSNREGEWFISRPQGLLF